MRPASFVVRERGSGAQRFFASREPPARDCALDFTADTPLTGAPTADPGGAAPPTADPGGA
eukprot:gene3922-2752_t